MIEIAISLAVIGFALVAILGVLPLGMSVQKENREETIINQDATVFMNAIRSGARGMDDLTNYVVAITNYQAHYKSGHGTPSDKYVNWYMNNSSSVPGFALDSGFRIIGLLSTPKYIPLANGFLSNYVVAAVRSLSGTVSDKFPQTNAALQDLAFSYRMIPEVVAFGVNYDNDARSWRTNPMALNLQTNLHEVRLTFRWPLAQGIKAPGRQVYRTIVGGSLVRTNESQFPEVPLFFLDSGAYVQARIP